MRCRLILIPLLAALVIAGPARATPAPEATGAPVGFRALAVPGIAAVVWYPTQSSGPVSEVAGNRVFYGVPVVRDAPLAGEDHPVVLLSHGYSGLWRNQAWLAEDLARAGFIAVALNHPGTSFGDLDPHWARDPARRPEQVSRVLDAVLADPVLGPAADRGRITVIGHSLGGATALLLAGGRFDPARLVAACEADRVKKLCSLYRAGGLSAGMAAVSARDPRISAAVLLDLEGIRAFTPDSLAQMPVPVLVLVSGVANPALPLGWEGRQQAALLPAAMSRYAEIIGGTHFSFMSLCKPGAVALLGTEAFVCEGEGEPRMVLHDEIARRIIAFLRHDSQMAFAQQQP